jgi:hypothetical protein
MNSVSLCSLAGRYNNPIPSRFLPPKKIYRLKEDQAFSLSLELGRREKVAWHPSADFLLPSVGGGGDFEDTVIAVKMI